MYVVYNMPLYIPTRRTPTPKNASDFGDVVDVEDDFNRSLVCMYARYGLLAPFAHEGCRFPAFERLLSFSLSLLI